MSARVLLVCLDSAEPRLLRAWAAAGALPNIRMLLDHGVVVDLENLRGFGNGVFWPCTSTGTGPGDHGRFFRQQLDPASYLVRSYSDDDIAAEPFWETLDRGGYRVAIIDYPHARLRPLANGLLVADWMTHDRTAAPRSEPPALIDELVRRHGDDPLSGNADARAREGMRCEALVSACEARSERKTQACIELLQERAWDLFAVSYADAHDIGHLYWHLHDPTLRNPADRPMDPLLHCYRVLDRMLGRLRQHCGEDTAVAILCGPGMEPNVTANLVLDDLLKLVELSDRCHRPSHELKLLSLGLRAPPGLRRFSRPLLRPLSSRLAWRAGRRARYLKVPHNDNAGAVRVNLAGRERFGVVPASDFEAAVCWLVERFSELRDAHGEPLVSAVVRPSTEQLGSHASDLPDLLFEWNRKADVFRLEAPWLGRYRSERRSGRTGDHSRYGMVAALGTGVSVPPTPVPPTWFQSYMLYAVTDGGLPDGPHATSRSTAGSLSRLSTGAGE